MLTPKFPLLSSQTISSLNISILFPLDLPTPYYCVVEHHKHDEGRVEDGEGYQELVETVAHVPGREHS